jgi:hypothetical protein
VIGVSVPPSQRPLVEEFFQLFKTSWEFFRAGEPYDIVLSTAPEPTATKASLVLIYSGARMITDGGDITEHARDPEGTLFRLKKAFLPIYGPSVTFPCSSSARLQNEKTGRAAVALHDDHGTKFARIGYDLFEEVRMLLTDGQPIERARLPALDLHIALLRELILSAGLPVIEIPPTPADVEFTVCLTHDIDHPLAVKHRFDHTMAGFFYRSTIGSVIDVATGRRRLWELMRNLTAAVRLPLAHLGLVADPWKNFPRYTQIEAGLGATYFVIPFANRPGKSRSGTTPEKRAVPYSLEEIRPELEKIANAGCEIGVHGIDSWADAESSNIERARLLSAGLPRPTGIRMHWLYFDSESPKVLDAAGFNYDSTFGYNSTVGYRAGTTQVYRIPGVEHLLELPLHIMDTALFYPSYLHLRPTEAHKVVDDMIEHAANIGGVLTFNWHDRSIAAERLWEEFYVETLWKLRSRKTWFSTAAGAVGWFKKRRSAQISYRQLEPGKFHVHATVEDVENLPPLTIRIYKPSDMISQSWNSSDAKSSFSELKMDQTIDLTLSL